MCGACGSGRVRAPWEDLVGAPGPRGPSRRAVALTRRLGPWRWRIGTWSGGYTISGPHGALSPASSVDEVVARARAARPDALSAGPGDGLDLADAVVRASIMAGAGCGGIVLAGPDPGDRRRVLAHGDVEIEVVPRTGAGWSVAPNG